MPFVYYGGKKGSAHRYPSPAFPTIIEPFAGSAGYALAWAKPSTRVILIEKDAGIVELWRRLQATDAAKQLLKVTAFQGDIADPFVAFTGGGRARLQPKSSPVAQPAIGTTHENASSERFH